MVKETCQGRPANWDRCLPAPFAYREVPTTVKPGMLCGRTIRGPITILQEISTNQELEAKLKATYNSVLGLREMLDETSKMVHESLENAQEKYKFYDCKVVHRELKARRKNTHLTLPSDRNKITMQWKEPFQRHRRRMTSTMS